MKLALTDETRSALLRAGHIPDDIRKRFDQMTPLPGGNPGAWSLTLSEDEAMELSELLQWHVRTDPATGQPTPETAPYAALIQAIADQQF
jgi:hypothetical protein